MQKFRGIYNIMATPFTADGAIDESSLRRLTEATIKSGVDGITILAVLGESQKLTDDERRRVLQVVMEVNAGRVPIIVGTTRDGTDTAIAASREAEEAGAAGLMIAAPTFLQPGPALTEHFRRIGEAVGIPIVLQDFPPVNGVVMSPKQMADLVQAVPSITMIKLEDTPTPQRIAQTVALVGDDATVVGGLGGMYLLDELRRGASGTMTGFSYSEVLISIWKSWDSGDHQAAVETYYRFLPLMVFEGQPKIGIAIRKEILRRRGFIDNAMVRHPGPKLDEGTLQDLTSVMDHLGMHQAFDR